MLPTRGFVWAACDGASWQVHHLACAPQPCLLHNKDDAPWCPASWLCLTTPACTTGHAGNCAPNPCPNEPLSCACAGHLCGPYLDCASAKPGWLTCVTPPDPNGTAPVALATDQLYPHSVVGG